MVVMMAAEHQSSSLLIRLPCVSKDVSWKHVGTQRRACARQSLQGSQFLTVGVAELRALHSGYS